MRHAFTFLAAVAFVWLGTGCGSAPALEGVSLGNIEFDGEHAHDVAADLEKALTAAGATVGQAGAPALNGTLTWEWAGEGETPYPTLVKVFIQSEPEDKNLTVTTRYAVAEGAQPRDVAHYRAEIVERVVGRIQSQNR